MTEENKCYEGQRTPIADFLNRNEVWAICGLDKCPKGKPCCMFKDDNGNIVFCSEALVYNEY